MTKEGGSIDDNFDIIIYLVTKFNGNTETYDFEDLLQVAFLGSLKAIKNFNPAVGPLRNYIFSSVRNQLLKFLNKEKQWQDTVRLEANISPDCVDSHDMLEFRNILSVYEDKLLPVEKNILELKLDSLTRKEICDSLVLTKNQYYTFLYSAIGKIKKYET
jgi:RNA polymerase sigma factor (sigma-70 family)